MPSLTFPLFSFVYRYSYKENNDVYNKLHSLKLTWQLAPENRPGPEKEMSIPTINFSGDILVSGRVTSFDAYRACRKNPRPTQRVFPWNSTHPKGTKPAKKAKNHRNTWNKMHLFDEKTNYPNK